MRAAVIRETGGPEVLEIEELDDPQPGPGEVLVRVRAAAVNPIEYKQRQGLVSKELPAVLGSDISGTVEGGDETFAVGDEVFGLARSGAYAELAATPSALLAHKPAALSHEQAAALPVASCTAWQALFDRGGLSEGQTALISGGAGGVGHLAVQLARHAGAHVIATGSERNRDWVTSLGAERYVDYAAENVADAAGEVDVAFDTVGGATTATLLPAVREGGVIVTIAGPPPEEAAARGVRTERLIMSPNADQLAKVAALVAEGAVRVEIAEVLVLDEVRRAHELSESGRTRGKIILVP